MAPMAPANVRRHPLLGSAGVVVCATTLICVCMVLLLSCLAHASILGCASAAPCLCICTGALCTCVCAVCVCVSLCPCPHCSHDGDHAIYEVLTKFDVRCPIYVVAKAALPSWNTFLTMAVSLSLAYCEVQLTKRILCLRIDDVLPDADATVMVSTLFFCALSYVPRGDCNYEDDDAKMRGHPACPILNSVLGTVAVAIAQFNHNHCHEHLFGVLRTAIDQGSALLASGGVLIGRGGHCVVFHCFLLRFKLYSYPPRQRR